MATPRSPDNENHDANAFEAKMCSVFGVNFLVSILNRLFSLSDCNLKGRMKVASGGNHSKKKTTKENKMTLETGSVETSRSNAEEELS